MGELEVELGENPSIPPGTHPCRAPVVRWRSVQECSRFHASPEFSPVSTRPCIWENRKTTRICIRLRLISLSDSRRAVDLPFHILELKVQQRHSIRSVQTPAQLVTSWNMSAGEVGNRRTVSLDGSLRWLTSSGLCSGQRRSWAADTGKKVRSEVQKKKKKKRKKKTDNADSLTSQFFPREKEGVWVVVRLTTLVATKLNRSWKPDSVIYLAANLHQELASLAASRGAYA